MDKVFSVSEFNQVINVYLSQTGAFLVEGEVVSINVSQNKWLFLTIKDLKTSLEVFGILDQIRNYKEIVPGMTVRVEGSPRLYSKSSKFSLQAKSIVPVGEGSIKQAFELLKEKLTKEGLFDISRKRSLAEFPEKVGLITASNSEGYHDFIKILNARFGGVQVYFYPVSVQGKESISSILLALNYFNTEFLDLDFVVLTRGGGSLEDLATFNNEEVARAIFASRFPVVVGVGHERDVTLADMVADLRASTPSNAAELCFPDKEKIVSNIERLKSIIASAISRKLNEKIGYVEYVETRFKNYLVSRVELKIAKIDGFSRVLKTLDFKNVLKRGFSITYLDNGKLLRFKKEVKKGDKIKSVLVDGEVSSVVGS